MDKKISEGLTEAIKDHVSQPSEEIATKKDLEEVKKDIENLRIATKKDLELLKKDIIIKLGRLMGLGIGILAILIKF